VAVAAFPRGNHATGGTRADDVAALLAKQRAGADFAITQVFWDAPSYLELVGEARSAGVTIPIIPGILPATDPGRLARVGELTGVEPPADLLARLTALDDPAQAHRVASGPPPTWSRPSSTVVHPVSTSTRSTSAGPRSTCWT